MATLLYTDGGRQEVTPRRGRTFSLTELQTYVGGYIELVRVSGDRLLVVNEEGLLRRLQPNMLATSIAGTGCFIVGDALLCKPEEID